ncbi:hypothetical protein [Vogesella sp. AC12]|uniref:hypothetical protein n=1 Tax=Vogesella sp. AC12 TaxID=2950550 RepID=UPI00210EEAE6|nr:hypothetical protein [Vogesella sp. AC12]MCQ4145982.1 hypothetical protein [Vogesella sp. AC12]
MHRSIAFTLLLIFSPFATAQDGAKFTSFAGFDLGKATLAQVAKRLGPAKILEKGEAGEYEAKICYRMPGGTIYFLSGEMGGPDHDLLGLGIAGSSGSRSCAEFRGSEVPSLELGGLRLGLSKAEFSRVVGGKVEWDGDVGRVAFESRRPITPAEFSLLPKGAKEAAESGQLQDYFDVVVSVVGTFVRGKLSAFQVWKVETL